MENLNDLKLLLSTPKTIALTTHRNPDGDAMGSMLACYHFLKRQNHRVYMIAPSEYPENFEWMMSIQECLIWDISPEDSKDAIANSDLVFSLDYNGLDRVDKLGEAIKSCTAKKVLIDHHLFPEDFADFVLSDTTVSSTCELVFDFINLLGSGHLIDPIIGDCLYTGILTDTGSFKHATTPKLFRTVAKLVEIGVDGNVIQDKIFNSLKEKHLRILGHCLYNRMEIIEEYQTGIIWLTKGDYEKYDIQRGDTEGIVNYLLSLKNVKIAAFIHEQPKITKLSLRSKGDFSVQEIASKYFKGGGHKNASGGASFIGLEPTIRKFKEAIAETLQKENV
jgi:phosphoesterase RecJ-like protein